MANSVGTSWAILKGRLTGDVNKASDFLKSLSPAERITRNRHESRLRRKAKKNYKMGQR